MAKERAQVAIPKNADETLDKLAEKMDLPKGIVAGQAINELAKKVLK